MRFIDLFSGLGGFHLALDSLGHVCVFACERDKVLMDLYEKNFGLKPSGDIRDINVGSIPSHEILCAGFPCQPFSKAGNQRGFRCPRNGDLFRYVLDIIKYHLPDYVLLENVANIQKHNFGRTWKFIKKELEELGYSVDAKKLSPHRIGIPQIRERFYIVGSRRGLEKFRWPKEQVSSNLSIKSVLDHNPKDARCLSLRDTYCLESWQQFIEKIPSRENIISPIWSMEFGATYPYKTTTPYSLSIKQLRKYRGSFGKKLKKLDHTQIMNALPSYARVKQSKFPEWKVGFIEQNRKFYNAHKSWINRWLVTHSLLSPSLQKLEWNCKGEKRIIWNYLIQFRASGVRVKRTSASPALVALNTTQVPVVGWERRYMTPKECSRLQSMENLNLLPHNPSKAFKALGNAVNVKVVESIFRSLIINNKPIARLALNDSKSIVVH